MRSCDEAETRCLVDYIRGGDIASVDGELVRGGEDLIAVVGEKSCSFEVGNLRFELLVHS